MIATVSSITHLAVRSARAIVSTKRLYTLFISRRIPEEQSIDHSACIKQETATTPLLRPRKRHLCSCDYHHNETIYEQLNETQLT